MVNNEKTAKTMEDPEVEMAEIMTEARHTLSKEGEQLKLAKMNPKDSGKKETHYQHKHSNETKKAHTPEEMENKALK